MPEHMPQHDPPTIENTGLSKSYAGSASGSLSFLTGGNSPPLVAGYEILGELGRGGMGVVYKARQIDLGRLVALKMVLAGAHASARELARFRHEAEALAQLQHPNIVQIHEVGENGGLPFFSLEYVAGPNLETRLRGAPQQELDTARLVETLARATHAAHERGVVHRDLKPSNVLLAPQSDVSSTNHQDNAVGIFDTCTPKITDFGLAKRLDVRQSETGPGAIVGTPSYMAPEQANVQGQEVGPAADIYSLGAILYECLTGRPPFKAATLMDTLLQVISDEPIPPTRLRPGVSLDLETICLKCLHKEPQRRYATALALADDLKRFQAGEPILARPISARERASKWAKRHPAIAALGTGILLVSLLGAGLVTWKWREAAGNAAAEVKAREEAVEQKKRAVTALARAERDLYFKQIALAERHYAASNLAPAISLLDACKPEFRGWEWNYLRRLCHTEEHVFRRHTRPVTAVAFSQDGTLASGDGNSTVILWDPLQGKELRTLRIRHPWVRQLAFSPDGKHLAVASGHILFLSVSNARGTSGLFRQPGPKTDEWSIFDVASGKELRLEATQPRSVFALVYMPGGKLALAVNEQGMGPGQISVVDSATGKTLHTLTGHGSWIRCLACSPNGKWLASGSRDNTVKLWDAQAPREAVFTLEGHTGSVTSVAFSPDNTYLVSAGEDHTVKIWDPQTGKQLRSLNDHALKVNAVAFSRDGRFLASAGEDRTVRLYDTGSWREHAVYRGHDREVMSVAFSADSRRLATCGGEPFESQSAGDVRVWDTGKVPGGRRWPRPDVSLSSLALAPDGRHVSVGGVRFSAGGSEVVTLDMTTGQAIFRDTDPTLVGWLAASRDGKRLAAPFRDMFGKNGQIKIWDLEKRQLSIAIPDRPGGGPRVRFSPDGAWVVTSGQDGSVTFWNTATDKEEFSLRGHSAPVLNFAFRADGEQLATADITGKVHIWDLATRRQFRSFQCGQAAISVAFSPDGNHVAAAGGDITSVNSPGEAILWELASGDEVFRLRGHTGAIVAAAFHPGGKRLATASEDQTVKIWDTTTGQEALTLQGRWPGPVHDLAFSRDGSDLATVASDRMGVRDSTSEVRVWNGRDWGDR